MKPGDSYGAPGMGNSTSIAVATAIALFGVWWVVTAPAFGPMIKPLFLPSPAQVWDKIHLRLG